MTSMNEASRKRVIALIEEEVKILDRRAKDIFTTLWNEADIELMEERGLTDQVNRAIFLKDQIEEMQHELQELESTDRWRGQSADQKEFLEVGLHVEVDRYGRVNDYNSPNVFGRAIKTKWDVAILRRLDEKLSLRSFYQVINQVSHSIAREIALAGTFEEARASYNQFYQLLQKACGGEIPPLLREIIDIPALQLPGSAEPSQ